MHLDIVFIDLKPPYRFSRVHMSKQTTTFLSGEFELEAGNGGDRDDVIRTEGIPTYLVKSVIKQVMIQQTPDIDPMLVSCWASVADGRSALNQYWVNIRYNHLT